MWAMVPERRERVLAGRCAGTYLHGALEDPAVLEEMLGIKLPPEPEKREHYDRLADWFEASADVRLFKELYL